MNRVEISATAFLASRCKEYQHRQMCNRPSVLATADLL